MGCCVFQWLLKVYLCSEGLSVCSEFPGLNVGGVSLCTQGCPCLGPLSGFRRREGLLLGFFAVCCTVRPTCIGALVASAGGAHKLVCNCMCQSTFTHYGVSCSRSAVGAFVWDAAVMLQDRLVVGWVTSLVVCRP